MESKIASNLSLLTGRAMLSAMFIMAGFSKLGGYAGTAAYMESFGLPGMLLPAVIALEIGGGLAILVGLQTRLAALALGAFTLIAAIVFHSDFSQPMQSILFSKNIAVVGGFLLLSVQGPGEWSLGSLKLARRARA
jgi:putative oxidoreductase